MTKLFKLFGFVAIFSVFASCSNDEEGVNVPSYFTKKKSSKVAVFIDKNITRACDVNGNMWASKPAPVSSEEATEVLKYIAENSGEYVDWPGYTRYFIQHVGGAHHLYSYTDWNGALHTGINGTAGFENLQVQENSGNWQHVYNFNAGKCDNAATNNSALMTDGFKAIKAMAEYASSWVEAYRIYLYNGNYYIGLDFSAIKGDGEVPADGIYDDWVVKIIPETVETPGVGDGNEEDDDNDDNDEGGNDGKEDDTTTVVPGEGEVEFDIHQQEHKDWNEIKTSIHLRDSVCVRVLIPIQREFIAVPDDFDIRAGIDYNYIVEREIVHYSVAGKEFETEVRINRADKGIEILIDGTTCKEALKLAREKYDDGITFEIHNYVYAHANDAVLDDNLIWNWLKLTECPQTSFSKWPGSDDCCTHTFGQISSVYFPNEEISYDKTAE